MFDLALTFVESRFIVRAYVKKPSGEVEPCEDGMIEIRNRFVKAIGGCSKVVTKMVGDEHLYSRTKFDNTTPVGVYPKDDTNGDGILDKYSPNSDIKHPFWNITAGNAGAPWYAEQPKQIPWKPEVIVSRLGYLIFEVSEDGVSVTAYSLRGNEVIEHVDNLMSIKK